jgi:hypothetical protein
MLENQWKWTGLNCLMIRLKAFVGGGDNNPASSMAAGHLWTAQGRHCTLKLVIPFPWKMCHQNHSSVTWGCLLIYKVEDMSHSNLWCLKLKLKNFMIINYGPFVISVLLKPYSKLPL